MFQFAYRGTSGVPIIKLLPVAAAQTLTKGEPVSINAGLVVAGAAAAANFVGVMNQDSNGADAGTLVEVVICDPETVFYVDFIPGAKGTLADSDIGTAFDLGAADNTSIDINDAVDGAWVVEKYDNDSDKAWVRCLAAKRHAIAG